MPSELQSADLAVAMTSDFRTRRESAPGPGHVLIKGHLAGSLGARLPRSSAPHFAENVPTHANAGSRRNSPRGFATSRLPRPAPTRVGLHDITNQDRFRTNAPKTGKNIQNGPSSRIGPPALPRSTEQGTHQPVHQFGHASVPVPGPVCAQVPAVPLNTNKMEICDGDKPLQNKQFIMDPLQSWSGDGDNIQHVGEYAPEIFSLLLKEEVKHLPRHNYMELQKDINAKMRAILMDWLVEVHMKYRLRNETLYLTVSTIDRYLTHMPVLRKKLQLVGVVAMFIAAKFEEINPPGVNDYEYITDNAYTKEDILNMECQMLTTLNFQIVVPTAAHFMDRLQRINDCDESHSEFVHYLSELALLEIRMMRFTPSHLVSAAILLSNELLGRMIPWASIMQEHTNHAEEQLRPCVEELRSLLEGAAVHWLQAVRKKYQSAPHHRVANGWPRT